MEIDRDTSLQSRECLTLFLPRPWFALSTYWYAQGWDSTWSDIYTFASSGDLGITATHVYSRDGESPYATVSVDYVLTTLDELLGTTVPSYDVAYLIEESTDFLVAVSRGDRTASDGSRLAAVNSTSPEIRAAAEFALVTTQRSIYQYFVLNVEDDEGAITKYWRFTAPIVDSGRLSWILTYLEAIDCGANYYLDEVALQCVQCEYPTKTSPEGAGYTCDACYDGFYVDGDGLCQPCPSGGVCEGGLAQPYPKRGHWGLKDHPTEFLECDQGDACLGGPNFECKEGYRGRMCERMDNDEFRVAGTQHRCPASSADKWLGTAGMVAGVVVLWHVINSIVCTYSDVTDMLLMTVQQCAIVFEFDPVWKSTSDLGGSTPNFATL